jgi:bifunctional non-homologous end joining protein LigD
MQKGDLPRVTLYYREGSSDKVYQCAIEASDHAYIVTFAYGRRGSTLNTGTKTSSPVDYPTAKSIYDKLVREKTSKGYTPGPDGTPYQDTSDVAKTSGILPQLLNPIEESDVEKFLRDSAYGAQEKYDGKRLLVKKEGAAVHGTNRKGLLCGLPSLVVHSTQRMPGDFILDGECVGETLHAFDLLMLNGGDLRGLAYRARYLSLLNVLAATPSHHQHEIHLAPLLTMAKEKAGLLKDLKELKREGIVFKRLDAPYTAGRPNSGGSQFKHKFYATLSAVVAKVNTQRSVEVRLVGRNGWMTAGNVTIPANHPIPAVGEVVEVRYLYAFPENGVLHQPVYLGKRTDIEPAECLTAQLKYKSAGNEEP